MAGARAFMRLLERAAGPRAPAAGAPVRMNVEEIEPRILHSAELTPFVTDDLRATQVEMRVVETPSESQLESAREERRHELVVVDSAVADYQQLVDDILANAGEDRQVDVIVLRPGDGMMRITDALAGRSDIDALHIVSHGSDGAIFLGRDRLDLATLEAREAEIERWGMALHPDADILLYGCDVAQSDAGRAMLQQLARVTGADVAASTDLTGGSVPGADWDLEYSVGTIEAAAHSPGWSGLLAALAVSTTSDVLDGDTTSIAALLANRGADGAVSLREALIAANNTAGTDDITLGAGTYVLSITGNDDLAASGDFDIRDSVNITGAGSASTIIDANALDRIFHAISGTATISDLTITDGSFPQGGAVAIEAAATVNLNRVVVSASSANSQGGAIQNFGTLNMTDARLTGNAVANGQGGALYNAASATLNRVTIDANTGKTGGGISNSAAGVLTLTNVTLSGNSATAQTGGAIQATGAVTATNVTITANSAAVSGGGVHVNGATVTLKNTIVAANTSATGPDVNGAIASSGYNLVGATAGSSGWIASDLQNTAPGLAALADNGGYTPTHALQAGSAAINAGTATGAPTVDQRGASRSAAPDIGAYESNAAPSITSPATATVTEGTTVVHAVTATDADGDALAYAIVGGADAARFTIDGANRLVFVSAPSHSSPADVGADNVYDVRLRATDARGASSSDQLLAVTVAASAGNSAPVLASGNDLPQIDEDSASNAGATVASLMNTTDADAGAASGMAVTGVVNTSGAWQFSTDGGASWSNFGAVSGTSARLLDAADRVRFVPNANWNGTVANGITFRAWDQTSGAIGGTADVTANGNATAFSAADASSSIVVAAVNDAPTQITPGIQTTALNTALVFSSANGNAITVSDIEAEAAGASVRVTLSATQGVLTLSGTAGLTFTGGDGTSDASMTFSGTVANVNAALAGLRFAPTTGYAGQAQVRIETDDLGSTGTGGALTAIDTVPLMIGNATNAAPVLTGAAALTAIPEDAATNNGTLVSALLSGVVTDADAGALSGIAVTGVANTNGTWQYSTDAGGTWTSFGAASETSARLLDSAAKVRFVANANWNGSAGITFRAWDQTSGVNGSTADTTTRTPAPYVLDSFNGTGYSNNEGNAPFASNWIETGDDGNASTGKIEITSDRLTFHGGQSGTSTIHRNINLAGASGATISFRVTDGAGNATVRFKVSGDGGATYTTAATDGGGFAGNPYSYTLLPQHVGANTRILFELVGDDGGLLGLGGAGGDFTVDELRIDWQQPLNGGSTAFSTSSHTSSVTVNPVNDAPVGADRTIAIDEDQPRTLSVADFGFTDPVEGHALKAVKITTLPGAGVLALNGVAVIAGDFVDAADIAANRLVYTPAANATAVASFTFQVQDTGGTANGGIDVDATPNTITFSITAVSDAPSGADRTIAATEDTAYVFLASDFGFSDAADGNALQAVKIATLGAGVDLRLNGVAVTANQLVSVADINAGRLVYTPPANANGASYASFTFQVQDNGGTAGGGVDLDPTPRTITIDVAAVNDAPVLASDAVLASYDVAFSALENSGYELKSGQSWGETFVHSPGAAYTADRIGLVLSRASDAPSGQTLTVSLRASWNGAAIASQTISSNALGTSESWVTLSLSPAATLNSGQTYFIRVDSTGSGKVYLGVNYSGTYASGDLINDSGSAQPGKDAAFRIIQSSNAAGTYDLTAISEDPVANAGTRVADLIAGRVTDVDSASVGIAVTGVVNTNGIWQYSTSGGSAWSAFAAPGASNATLLASDASTYVRFVPNAHWNGVVTDGLSFKAWDGSSGVAGTTADTTTGSTAFSADIASSSITVAAVNDAPAGTDRTITTLEDTAIVLAATHFGFTDVDGHTLQAVKIAGLPDAGSLRLNGVAVVAGQSISAADLAAGRLEYTPAANANGAAYASFTFQVQDTGGTANGGVDLDPTPRTMTIDVTAVQDAPTLSGAASLAAISEDATGNAGTLVSALIATHFADADAGAQSGIAVTAVDNSNGTWQYSTNAGSTWSNFGSPSGSSARLLASDAKVRFVPDANWNGTVANGITFRAWDRTTGVNGGTAVTIPNPTYRDDFSSVSYANNDGTANWSGNWVDSDNDPTGGRIAISGGWLEIRTNNPATIYREVDLSGATSAQLSFTFSSTIASNDTSVVTIYASSNGGASYSQIGTFSSSSLTGAGSATGDISSFISANTRIRFEITTTESPSETVFIGSLQITTVAAGNGGATAFSSATATSGITVTPVNDAPTGTSRTVTTAEDVPFVFDAASFGFGDAVDGAANGGANSLAAVRISALPAAGALRLDGIAVTAGQVVSIADIAAGRLAFTPAANASGSAYASFEFQVQDDGGTASGGVNLDPTARTMTVSVTARNDAPVGTDGTQAVLEEGYFVFSSSSFGFTDPNDGGAHGLRSVRIASLPTAGTLTLNGVAVTAGQFIDDEDIDDGDLVWRPAANGSGAGYSSFTFQVRDDGGTANGGADLDTVARTFTLDVTPINDAPVGTSNTVTTLEDTAHTFTAADFGFTDPIDGLPNSLAAVRIVTGPASGSLRLDGVAVTNGQLVSAADIAAGKLVYTPVANANGAGYASFTFRVQDNGGTANGGVDFDATARTMRIDVTAVNDAPSGSDVAVGTTENVAFVFSASAFGYTDSRDGDELLAVRIDTLPLVGTLELSGVSVTAGQVVSAADIADGKLVYTPVANQSGAAFASFRFRVQDDGGTANGGVDSDATFNTLTVDVGPINHAPVGDDATLAIDEDSSFVFSRGTFGFSDANDVLVNNFAAVRITTLPTAGTLKLNGSAVTAGQFVTVADLDAGKLVYQPAADANGAGHALFMFQVKDDGGTANGGADLDAVANTITFDVAAVNDAPTGADATVTVLEDAAHVFDVAAFGYADARDGGLHNLVSVRVDALPAAGSLTLDGVAVAAGQSITAADIAAGKLVYAPAANGNGAAYSSFTFRVQDDGGTASGGADLDSVARTMRVDVTPVDDAPTGTSGTVTAREDTPYVFDASAFGFGDAVDGGAHALAAVKIATLPVNGTLMLDGVAVAQDQFISAADIAAGRLVFTPAAHANGAAYASFTFLVQDDGGTANSGTNLDAVARTLNIDVAAVNDAPAGTSATFTLLEDTPYTLSAAHFGFTDALDGHGLEAVKIATVATAGQLTLNGAAVSAGQFVSAADIAAGKLVYTPGANANGAGYASFTFQVRDNGGTSNGGANLEPVANTLVFDVTAVNDAPTGADGTVVAVEDTPYVFAPSAFGFGDAADSGAHGMTAVRIGGTAGAGTLALNGVEVVAGQWIDASDIAAGRLVFTPAANAHGAGYASFTFQLKDDGGVADGGTDVDAVSRTMTIDVASVNDAPAGTSATVTIREDSTLQLDIAAFGFADAADGNALRAVTITALPTAGTLTLNGVAVVAGQSIDAADIAAGKLVFAPATDAAGNAYASFAFLVQDDGGGADTDGQARTLTVNVLAVNDAPVGIDGTVHGFEDTPLVFTSAAFGFVDAIDGHGLLAVAISSLPSAGVLTLDGVEVRAGQLVSAADIAAGKLVFNPGADESGATYASLTFHVQDDGGVANGGADLDPIARTLNIDLAELNDAPQGSDVTRTLAQDTSHTVTTSAFGFHDSADTPANALAGIDVVALPRAGMLRLDGVALSIGQFVSADDIDAGKLVYTPSAGGAGTAYASFEYQVVDAGASGGGSVNTDTVARSFTFNVTPRPIPVIVADDPVVAPPLTAAPPAVQTMPVAAPSGSSSGSSAGTSPASSSTSEKSSSSTATGSTITTQSASKTVEQGAANRAAAEAAATGATSGAPAGGSGGGGTSAAQVLGGVSDVRPVEIAGQGAAAGVQRLDSQVRSDSRNLGPVLNVATDAPLLLAQIQMGDAVSDLGKAFGMLQSSSSSAAANAAVEQRQLMQQLDEVRDTLAEQTKLEASTVAASASAAVSLSVGYVVWLLRGGVLVSTFLSAMPAWRLVDPLPILERLDEEDGEDDDSLESLVARNNVAAAESDEPAVGGGGGAMQVEPV